MELYDVVIVGGGPAGFNAAKTIKEIYPDRKILIVNDRDDLQIPCSIPYVIGGKIPVEENKYPLEKLKGFGELLIDRAIGIEPNSNTLFTQTKRVKYEKLILATGWLPRRLNVPGTELEGIFYIDTTTKGVNRIKEEVKRSKRIALIGAGFISIGFADQISRNFEGKEITVIEASNRIASGVFSTELELEIENRLKDRGVKVLKEQKVLGFEGEKRVKAVLTDELKIDTDLVLIFIGFVPNTRLAVDSGIKIERGFIEVDPFLRTSADNVLAAGNCIIHTSVIDGRKVPGMLASISARDGRLVGINTFGPQLKDEGIVPAGITEVGGQFYGFAGYTEKSLSESGFSFKSFCSESTDAYPKSIGGCNKLYVKLYFTEKGLIVGGEFKGESRGVWALVELTMRLIEGKRKAWEIAGTLSTAFPPITPPPLSQPLQEAAVKFMGEV